MRGSNNGSRIATYGSEENTKKGNLSLGFDICGAAVVFWEFEICSFETGKS